MKPFFTLACPCEACGEPTSRPRAFDPERQIWIATDCSCQAPACPALLRQLERARTVAQVREIARKHRVTCPQCHPIRKAA